MKGINVTMFTTRLVALSTEFPEIEFRISFRAGKMCVYIPKGPDGDFANALVDQAERLCAIKKDWE